MRGIQACTLQSLTGMCMASAEFGARTCRYLWRETYRDLGLDDDSIQSAFNGPAFLAWSRSYESGWQNGAIFDDAPGSPGGGLLNVSLQDEFLTNQWALQVRRCLFPSVVLLLPQKARRACLSCGVPTPPRSSPVALSRNNS